MRISSHKIIFGRRLFMGFSYSFNTSGSVRAARSLPGFYAQIYVVWNLLLYKFAFIAYKKVSCVYNRFLSYFLFFFILLIIVNVMFGLCEYKNIKTILLIWSSGDCFTRATCTASQGSVCNLRWLGISCCLLLLSERVHMLIVLKTDFFTF